MASSGPGVEFGGVGVAQQPRDLPLREIPGSYGLPLLGPLKDRWDILFLKGPNKFFQKCKEKLNSTVIRTNMPPAWPWLDSRCIMLLDQRSYCTVFNYDLVDKTDTFAGTFMPSLNFTGGLRMCAYLDPSEERHTALKSYCFELLKMGASRWVPEFHKQITVAFLTWEVDIAKQRSADFTSACSEAVFKTLIKGLMNVDLDSVPDGERPSCVQLQAWIGLQFVPVGTSGRLWGPLEDLVLHSVPIPHQLTQCGYDKMVKFVHKYACTSLDVAQRFGVSRDDAAHNLIFFTILNALGGLMRFFPSMIKLVGAQAPLQAALCTEIREAVKLNGGLNMTAVQAMPLLESTVYEVMRFEPSVPYQYGRAKHDFILESHDAAYQIKKGELLGGVASFALRDEKVFVDPTTFKPERFMGEEGKKLLHYHIWSNGRQTDESSVLNKQCAAKDFVPFLGRLLLAELFVKYDSYSLAASKGEALVLAALSPASF